MKFLKKKNAIIVFEENNLEVVKKEIEYRGKSTENTLIRIFKSSHEVDNLRDVLMVNQIKKLSYKHPEKDFIIVRGNLHKNLSDYLKRAGFEVLECTY